MNQREIKFRTWNKERNRMANWEEVDVFPMHANLKAGDIYMQYTGLKDKNGKEIYEGDLFNCIYYFDGCKKHKLIVVWHESSASFKAGSKGMNDLTREEVIGNIYENPELLK